MAIEMEDNNDFSNWFSPWKQFSQQLNPSLQLSVQEWIKQIDQTTKQFASQQGKLSQTQPLNSFAQLLEIWLEHQGRVISSLKLHVHDKMTLKEAMQCWCELAEADYQQLLRSPKYQHLLAASFNQWLDHDAQ